MFKKNSIFRRRLLPAARAGQNYAIFSRLISLLFIVGLSGCQTIPPLPPANLAEPGWIVRQGQTVWRTKKDAPEITGDLLLAVNLDGRSFLQFTKTPLPF